MADTLKTMPIASLSDVAPQSSDKLVTYRDSDKDAHVSTVGELSETLNENISDAFSTSKSYAVGDYCIYNDTLYKCTTAHNKASWNSSHFEAVTVGEELSELNTNNSFKVIRFILPSITISGNGVNDNSYDLTESDIPDGYVPIALIGYNTYSSNIFAQRANFIGGTKEIFFALRNVSSSSVTTNMWAEILFAKGADFEYQGG